jgi:heavy metal efflux system protein
VAGNLRRANGAANHDSARDRDERHAARNPFAVVLAVRPLRHQAHFRRRGGEFWDRERALERLSQVNLPPAAVAAGVSPQIQTDWSPAGQIYFFTLHTTNPAYDVMELKSIEDWVVEKNFKAVPNIVDVASFGGPTREYQVRVDPDKLISYGLSIGQVEQQLTNNNANGGRKLHRSRPAADQYSGSGPGAERHDIENTVISDQERHAAPHQGYRRGRAGSEDPPGPVCPAIRHEDGWAGHR